MQQLQERNQKWLRSETTGP